jgi:hypothetical protein
MGPTDLTTCIGCGCDDLRACEDLETGEPCHWLRQNVIVVPGQPMLGVCSGCAELVEPWDAGDRTIRWKTTAEPWEGFAL